MKKMLSFAIDLGSYSIKGGVYYYSWLLFLLFFILVGSFTTYRQVTEGLILTGVTDLATWELYVSNFIFCVHIAAASVLVTIYAYIVEREHMKDLSVFAEIIAMVTVVLGVLFIVFHLGRPDRIWHALPVVGVFNIPNSMLDFDIIVLNGYLIINIVAVFYFLYRRYTGQPVHKKFYTPLLWISCIWGPLIHICTAAILQTMPVMHLWHSSSMPFMFLSMAGASGPALVIMVFLAIRKFTEFHIHDDVIDLFTKIIIWSLAIIILLIFSEVVTELYASTEHADSLKFNMFGGHGISQFVPWFWTTRALILITFIMLLIPRFRKSYSIFLPGICFVVFMVILLEKHSVLVLPAFMPTPLGEYFEYDFTFVEVFNVVLIWALGFFAITLLTKGAVGILLGKVRHRDAPPLVPQRTANVL